MYYMKYLRMKKQSTDVCSLKMTKNTSEQVYLKLDLGDR